jgi:hypothetical protein
MITIKINDPGHTIKFPRMNEVRTPCKINISEKNLNSSILELKRLGISKYVIISNDETIKTKEFKPKPINKETKVIIKEQIIKTEDHSNLEKRFGVLEELLKQALNKPSQIINKYGSSEEEIINEDSIIEEVDDFIPSIDLEGMEIKGSSFKTQKSTSDAEETSKLLSKITKKYNKYK